MGETATALVTMYCIAGLVFIVPASVEVAVHFWREGRLGWDWRLIPSLMGGLIVLLIFAAAWPIVTAYAIQLRMRGDVAKKLGGPNGD